MSAGAILICHSKATVIMRTLFPGEQEDWGWFLALNRCGLTPDFPAIEHFYMSGGAGYEANDLADFIVTFSKGAIGLEQAHKTIMQVAKEMEYRDPEADLVLVPPPDTGPEPEIERLADDVVAIELCEDDLKLVYEALARMYRESRMYVSELASAEHALAFLAIKYEDKYPDGVGRLAEHLSFLSDHSGQFCVALQKLFHFIRLKEEPYGSCWAPIPDLEMVLGVRKRAVPSFQIVGNEEEQD